MSRTGGYSDLAFEEGFYDERWKDGGVIERRMWRSEMNNGFKIEEFQAGHQGVPAGLIIVFLANRKATCGYLIRVFIQHSSMKLKYSLAIACIP